MDTFENMMESGDNTYNDAIMELQKTIDDPNTPEETRKQLINQIEELKQNQKLVNETYEKNKKIAKTVLKSVEKISGLIVTEEEIQIIEKYEQEIMATYTGFPVPELPDGNFPKLDLGEYK